MKTDKSEREAVKRLLGMHPIKDATASLRFWVTKDDIENGVPSDPQNCAWALSFERLMGHKSGVAVFPTTVYVPTDKHGDGKFIIERYNGRRRARKAIHDFDNTGRMEPGEYTIFPPSKAETLEGKKKSSRKHRAKVKAQPKTTTQSKKKTTESPELKFLEVRNGTGKAHIVAKSLLETQPS